MIDIDELLNRQFRKGELLVQCREHMDRHITRRPPMCTLCRTDQVRALERVIEINDFLKTWRDNATALIKILNKVE
jgi:hypothetical protein